MVYRNGRNYTESGALIINGKVVVTLHGGASSIGGMVAGIGSPSDGMTFCFDSGYNHATSVQLAIYVYEKMPEHLKKVFTVTVSYLGPSGGIAVRFDCDIRDVKTIIIEKGEEISLDEIPEIKQNRERK